jgi:hypothetical protein
MEARTVVVRLDAFFFGEKNGSGRQRKHNLRPLGRQMKR